MNIMKKMMVGLVVLTASLGVRAESTTRIVCLGGAVTETVWALGAGEQVVGIDDSSSFPPEAMSRPRVGYYRMISAEGVISLQPNLVLASEEAGPPEAMSQLEAAGVRVVRVPGSATVSGCVARIRAAGVALQRTDAANELTAAIESSLNATIKTNRAASPRVLFIFARGAGTLNVAGQGTAADEIIRLAGGLNAVTGYTGYRPLTAESVAVANPDVVLITSSGLAGMGGVEAVWALPGLSATDAGRASRLVAMDDLLLLGFGPRLPQAVRKLSEALHP
jgi:iron complex transport system substrate-binding protein